MTMNDEFEKVIRKCDVMVHVLRKLLLILTTVYLLYVNFSKIFEIFMNSNLHYFLLRRRYKIRYN